MTAIPARHRGRKTVLHSSTPALSDKRADFTEIALALNIGAHPKKPDKIQQSPRGLLTNTTSFGWDHEHGFRIEETGPGRYAIKGPEPRQKITDYISNWRTFAAGLIEASDKKPADYNAIAKGDVLDRACAAALVLKHLDKVEIYLRAIDRDFADRSEPMLIALMEALSLATRVHQLAIVDNEIDISTTMARRRFLKERRINKSKQAISQCHIFQKKADEIWRKHPDWGKSQVARVISEHISLELKSLAQIAKEPISDLTTNFHTIRRLIKKTKLTK
jgi:hypothetical protein